MKANRNLFSQNAARLYSRPLTYNFHGSKTKRFQPRGKKDKTNLAITKIFNKKIHGQNDIRQ